MKLRILSKNVSLFTSSMKLAVALIPKLGNLLFYLVDFLI